MHAWKTIVSFLGPGFLAGAMLVSGSVVFGNLSFAKKCWRILQVFERHVFTQISFDSWWCVWCPLSSWCKGAKWNFQQKSKLVFAPVQKSAVAPMSARCLQCHEITDTMINIFQLGWNHQLEYLASKDAFPPPKRGSWVILWVVFARNLGWWMTISRIYRP